MIILNDEEGKEVIEAFSELERLAYLNMMQPRKARITDMQELAHKMYKKFSELHKHQQADIPVGRFSTGK